MGRGKSQRTLDLIDAAIAILKTIQPCSVRAVCYQLFTKGLIASMAKNETNKVSTQLTWAREQGRLPWDWIVDETREAERVSAWENPAAYVEEVKRSYRRDRWNDQPERIEVWSEKGTIRGTLAPVLDGYGTTFRVMHGYSSATTLYQVSQESLNDKRPMTAFYLGDWDPSGLHMSEIDLPTRIADLGGKISVKRIALTNSDISDPSLSFFWAETKAKDPRFKWYRARYGPKCWELDALNPVILRRRVFDAILARLDRAAWRRADIAEAAERESLLTILNAWPGISRRASKYSSRPDRGKSR